MPGGNRMRPMGQGPMPGGGAGSCGGAGATGFGGGVFAAGAGGRFQVLRGGGGGGRPRRWFGATGLPAWWRSPFGWVARCQSWLSAFSRQTELAALKRQAAGAEEALAELKARILELEQPGDASSART
jgi:hypothetical protein